VSGCRACARVPWELSPPTAKRRPKVGSTADYTDKQENQIFLIYKEIQSGAVAKSYMRKSFLIYEENLIFFLSVYCHPERF
jgi:hypothetical protein